MLIFFCAFCGDVTAQDIEELYEAGQKYLDAGEFDKAIAEFQKALQIDPNLPPVYNLLGITYLRQQKSLESAIGSFQEAIRIDPHYADAHFNLAVTYAGVGGQPGLALESFTKVIEIDPSFSRAHLGLGWLTLFEEKDPKGAIGHFEKAVALSPDQPESHFGLGMAYVTMGKKELALKPISILRSMNRFDLAGTLENMVQEKKENQEI